VSTATQFAATVDDLYRVDGKAELIAGRIVHLMATGRRPNVVASRIVSGLDDFAEAIGEGEAYTDNIGYVVPVLSSGRESFSPDASYFLGPFSENEMRLLDGAPVFAAEVRSENDYGAAAEASQAAKRRDYFEAGTAVVWDVDPINERILKYTSAASDQPKLFIRGEHADAEPAVPGWKLSVDEVFKRRSLSN
jgi:hypothetical protein